MTTHSGNGSRDPTPVEKAAELIAATRLERRRLDGLPEEVRPATEADAYAVQDALHRRLETTPWGRRVGYKIGCTTPVMQEFLGIHNPCAGGVFAPSTYYIAATVPFDSYLHAGVECEVVAYIGEDLPPGSAPHDMDSVAGSVAALFAGIEIVDDRWEDYGAVDTPSLIADDFFHAGCVVSQPVGQWDGLRLDGLPGRMKVNGEVVGEGSSGDILGHPFEALAWLANSLAERDRYLRRDEIVMLGSVVETQWMSRGDEVEVEIEGLGGALVKFE